ncbi:MAG: ATP-binding protein [Bacteroidota bacterium]|nr:ATP-binding protein [Bacteroidota bacterium]
MEVTLIPLIWWGLVAVLVGVAAWFFGTLYRHRQTSNAHWKEQLDIIEYFSESVFRQNTTEDILWDIASSCIEKIGLEDCVIYLRDHDQKVWVQKAAYGPKNVDYRAIHEPMELAFGQGIVGRVGQTGVAEIVADTASDGAYVVDDAVRGSEMAVPIRCDGEVIGVIDSEHTLPGFFQPFHLRVMQSVANICGQKIGRSLGEERIQEFAKFFQLNPNPVARIGVDGDILLSNEAACDVLGEECDRLGRLTSDHPLREWIGKAMVADGPIQAQLQVGASWFQVAMAPVQDKPFLHMYAVDVTEVQLARTRAADAERHKSDFLSVMSHEIRTPLNAILGLIELMMREESGEEERLSHLSYMEFAGKHLKGLLTDVLDLERLDSGKAEPHVTPFAPRDVFKRVVNGFEKRAEATRNRLKLEVSDAVPDRVLADVGWLTQMANNLLANALKFTTEGSITCSVNWETEGMVFQVADTGLGIADEDLGRILEPFEQARNAPVNVSNQGVGLGLAITKKLVTLHGGVMDVQSTLGEGTTFVIRLPLDVAEDELELSANQVSSAGTVTIPTAPVLIVDDNELNVLVASRMVTNWGYEVLTASDVDEAEAQMKVTLPFLVLLDIHMPGRDGFEAAQEWRASDRAWNALPIVGLTADAETRTRMRALDAGMNDVVVKPFNPPHLRSVIERFTQV